MYARILVPIDGSRPAQRGLDEAVGLARQLGSTLRLLVVVDARQLIGELSAYAPPPQVLALLDEWREAGERRVADAVASVRAQGIAAEGIARCHPGTRVCDVILEEAREWGAELIVMGTHGRRGLRRVALGSDAELVVRESAVPVLLLRDPANDGTG